MIGLIGFFLVVLVLFAVVMWHALPSWVALALFVVMAPLIAGGVYYSMGEARPLLFTPEELDVRAAYLDPEVAIHVLVVEGGGTRYVTLPWNDKLAGRLQEMSERRAKGDRRRGILRRGPKAEWSLEMKALPQLPPKH